MTSSPNAVNCYSIMNPRITTFFITLFILAGLGAAGVLRGQVAAPTQHLTVFFSGDGNGEVAPCG